MFRAFGGAFKIEKLKAPLIPGPEGAVDTNDWCISWGLTYFDEFICHGKFGMESLFLYAILFVTKKSYV